MLRIYDNVIAMMPALGRVLDAIERRDGDLARQGRKALQSVALNLGEGSYSQGANRQPHGATWRRIRQPHGATFSPGSWGHPARGGR